MTLTIAPTDPRPLRGCPIAVLDFESTGIDPKTARPVQVAITHCDLGETEPEVALNLVLKPGVPIPAEASEVHGITDADVVDAPTFAEAWPQIRDALEGRLLVVFNLPYDWQMLIASCERDGIVVDVPFGGVCVYVIARTVDKYQKGKKLEQVCGRRGITFDAHDAAADTVATALLLPILLNELGRGVVREGRYGPRREGPWCNAADLASVAAFCAWTISAGIKADADLDAYFRKVGKEPVDQRWLKLSGGAL